MSPVEFTAYVALGSNLSGPWTSSQEVLDQAKTHLQTAFGSKFCCSTYFQSRPIQAEGPNFVNAVASFTTMLEPIHILQELHAIENLFGRERPYFNAPRILDLDLLACQWSESTITHTKPIQNFQSTTPSLTLPHPRLHKRAFVVVPLMQIAPMFAIAGLGNVKQWVEETKDQSVVPL